MGYLDNNGLSYLWGKIKAYVDNHSGGSSSHVGMIIQSTTLDTMAKVIAVYGGTKWIRHSGYFLYGASSGVVANSAAADGGEATHTLTVDEMPSHGHRVFSYYEYTAGQWDGLVYQGMYNEYRDHGMGWANFIENTGGGAAHNNMPPYKNVYIWERTA